MTIIDVPPRTEVEFDLFTGEVAFYRCIDCGNLETSHNAALVHQLKQAEFHNLPQRFVRWACTFWRP
jgi:hypothetical protein